MNLSKCTHRQRKTQIENERRKERVDGLMEAGQAMSQWVMDQLVK